MAAIVLNGTELSLTIKEDLKTKINDLKTRGIAPGLAVIIVGGDPASRVYVNMKKKDCEQIGIESFEYEFPDDINQAILMKLIDDLNKDPKINGILVQLPLPKHLDEEKVINAINPSKDVDCFHPFNVGQLMIGNPVFMPCTPAGVMDLIEQTGVDIAGKECVVVGRSNIVGKPQAIMLLSKNGTVTISHSKTKNLSEVCKRADILVVAVGRPEFIKADAVKPGAIVIDVGVNRVLGSKKLIGDVEFDSVSKIASYITPPIGGVGPMTRVTLMKNTVKAALMQNGLSF
jgi:methylenetetrahydrofolate dehydrogenase (NADP+) / methenyltetrahydrofolate cyclohydrolase